MEHSDFSERQYRKVWLQYGTFRLSGTKPSAWRFLVMFVEQGLGIHLKRAMESAKIRVRKHV